MTLKTTLLDRFLDWFCGALRPPRAQKLTEEQEALLRKYSATMPGTICRVYHADRYFLIEGANTHSFPYPFRNASLKGLGYLLDLAFQGRPGEAFALFAGGEYWWRRWEWDRVTGTYGRKERTESRQ